MSEDQIKESYTPNCCSPDFFRKLKIELDNISGPSAYLCRCIAKEFFKWAQNYDTNASLRSDAYSYLKIGAQKKTFDNQDHFVPETSTEEAIANSQFASRDSTKDNDKNEYNNQSNSIEDGSFGGWVPSEEELDFLNGQLDSSSFVQKSSYQDVEESIDQPTQDKKSNKKRKALKFLKNCLDTLKDQTKLAFGDANLAYRLFFSLYDCDELKDYRKISPPSTKIQRNGKSLQERTKSFNDVEKLLDQENSSQEKLSSLFSPYDNLELHEVIANKLVEENKESFSEIAEFLNKYDRCDKKGPTLDFEYIKYSFTKKLLEKYIEFKLKDALTNDINFSLLNSCIEKLQTFYSQVDLYSELKIEVKDSVHPKTTIELKKLYFAAIISQQVISEDACNYDNGCNPYRIELSEIYNIFRSPFEEETFKKEWAWLNYFKRYSSFNEFKLRYQKFVYKKQICKFLENSTEQSIKSFIESIKLGKIKVEKAKFFLFSSTRSEPPFNSFANCFTSYDGNLCVLKIKQENKEDYCLFKTNLNFNGYQQDTASSNKIRFYLSPYTEFVLPKDYESEFIGKVARKESDDRIFKKLENLETNIGRDLEQKSHSQSYSSNLQKYAFNSKDIEELKKLYIPIGASCDDLCSSLENLSQLPFKNLKALKEKITLIKQCISVDSICENLSSENISELGNIEVIDILLQRASYFIKNGYYPNDVVNKLIEKKVSLEEGNLSDDVGKISDQIRKICKEINQRDSDNGKKPCTFVADAINKILNPNSSYSAQFSNLQTKSKGYFSEIQKSFSSIAENVQQIDKEIQQYTNKTIIIYYLSSIINHLLSFDGCYPNNTIQNFIKKYFLAQLCNKNIIADKDSSMMLHYLLTPKTEDIRDYFTALNAYNSSFEDEFNWLQYFINGRRNNNKSSVEFDKKRVLTTKHLSLTVTINNSENHEICISEKNDDIFVYLLGDDSNHSKQVIQDEIKFSKKDLYLEKEKSSREKNSKPVHIRIPGNFSSHIEAAINSCMVLWSIESIKLNNGND